jgi:flagellin-like hook-associated protein FlgL
MPVSTAIGDINSDGFADIVVSDWSTTSVSVFLGQSGGTYKAAVSYATSGGSRELLLSDFNDDGNLDIADADGWNAQLAILSGNGDGTFKGRVTYAAPGGLWTVATGDLNGDDVLDLITGGSSDDVVGVHLANSHQVTTMSPLNITTQTNARQAMTTIEDNLDRIAVELGVVGSSQSRLSSALNTLSVTRENLLTARSQIMDSDIADEAAQLVRGQILQKAAAAVLAQANQLPALALKLLKPD